MRGSQASASGRLRRTGDARAETLPSGHVIAARYQVESLIGKGGMGAVYTATHLVSGKRVALKWMLPGLSEVEGAGERFIREARATARIDHPNVVDVYDVGTEDQSVYLVMELLHGESLATRLDRGQIPPEQAIGLLMPALRGVAAAHAQGVIHRDLKPDNIFLCQSPDGEPREAKVLDFGISKIASGQDLRDLSLTASGTVMGTPYYMSPEQVRGLKETDARSDVYGFGVILYELLTDRYPFDADSYNELIVRIVTAEPTTVREHNPNVDPELSQIVARAMARDPNARFQSVAELAQALEPFAGGVPFRPYSSIPGEISVPVYSQRVSRAAPVEPPARAAPSTKPSRRLWWAAAGAAVVLVAAVAWLWSAQGHEPPPHVASPAPPETPAPSAPAPAAPIVVRPVPVAPSSVAADSTGAPTAAPSAAAAPASDDGRRARRRARSERETAAPPPGALPSDWDERLPTTVPEPKPSTPAGPPSVSGHLSREDL